MTVFVAGILLFVRRPHASIHPQLFAEDGIIFWVEDYLYGYLALLRTYGGYFPLTARLIAYLSSFFDPRFAPGLFFTSALLTHLAVVALLMSTRVRLPCKFILAALTIIVPHTNEVFTNATNVQWPLTLALILFAIAEDAETKGEKLFDRMGILFVGMSGPSSIVLLPAFALRWWLRGTHESRATFLFALVPTIIQGSALLLIGLPPGHSELNVNLIATVMSYRLWETLLLGFSIPNAEPNAWLAIFGFLASGAFLFLSAREGPWRSARLMIALCWLCLTASVTLRFAHDVFFLTSPIAGDRYFYVQHVLVLWWLIIEFASTQKIRRYIPLALASVCVAMGYSHFIESPRPILPWESELAPVREGQAFSIATLPEGWKIVSPGR